MNQNPNQAVIGKVDHRGYVLFGARGRHYIFGGLAIADYTDSTGKRLIVTLQEQEDSNALPDPDQFLYFRELATGNRWAIARRANANGRYAVHFQPFQDPRAGGQRPAWQAFQQADYADDTVMAAGAGRPFPEGGSAQRDLQFRSPIAPPRVATNPAFGAPGVRVAPVYSQAGGCCGQ